LIWLQDDDLGGLYNLGMMNLLGTVTADGGAYLVGISEERTPERT
jgi:hypothetical protein